MKRCSAPPGFRAVILDMDGLVLDSETTYCRAWQRAATALGHTLTEDFFETLFGRDAEDVVRLLAAAIGTGFDRHAFFTAAEGYWHEQIRLTGVPRMPGVDILLDRLRDGRVPHALATNSAGQYARLCLDHGGLGSAFPVIVTRDQVARGKPEPDVFLEAARRLGVAPAECLVLEDSATGLSAARAAGMRPVLVQRRAARRESLGAQAWMAFPSLTDFVAWWERRAAGSPEDRPAPSRGNGRDSR